MPNDGDREERPLCNPQFAGKIGLEHDYIDREHFDSISESLQWSNVNAEFLGFLPKDETLAIFDDGKRLWVPPVALQGLLPAALLEVCLGCSLLFYHVLLFESL